MPMSTIVFFHAHPDDEAILTAGTAALAARDGHRCSVVLATRGEHGEPVEGSLAPGEQLGLRRVREAFASAEALGIARVEFLGYVDSGMMGESTNDDPYSFWSTPLEFAAERLATILREEAADVLVVYDSHGGYGHPDHIKVHRVGHRAAELAGTPKVLETTMNRDHLRRLFDQVAAENPEAVADLPDIDDGADFGSSEDVITHAIDVTSVLGRKRTAMRCHSSQIGEDDFFLLLDDEQFGASFGTEWFIDPSRPRNGKPFVTDVWG